MPTNAVTFVDDEFDMRWKEPYLTEGLNEKAMVIPRGVYRGFDVLPAGVALTVTITAAAPKNDHLAVIETQNDYSLTLRRDTGNFNVDLTAYAGVTVVLALYVTYSIGTTTAAFLRVYTQAEYNALTTTEKNELTVLATVIVPGAGLIPAASISYELRTYPWQNASTDILPWVQVVRNGSFDMGEAASSDDGAIPHWMTPGSATAAFRRSTTDPDTGEACLEYFHNIAGLSTAELIQNMDIPVQSGQNYTFSFRLKRLIIPTAVAIADVQLRFRDATGVISSVVIPLNLTAVDGAYATVTSVGTIPSGSSALLGVRIYVTGLDYGIISSIIFRIDNISWNVRPLTLSQREVLDHGISQYLNATRMAIRQDEGAAGYSAAELLLKFLTSGTGIPLEGAIVAALRSSAATTAPALHWKGRAQFGSNMLGTEANALKARIEAGYSLGAGVDLTLLLESTATASTGYRIYASQSNELVITSNASWDGTNWNKDVVGQPASLLEINRGFWNFANRKSTDAGPWTVWDNIVYIDGENRITYNDRQLVLANALNGTEANALLARIATSRPATGGAAERVQLFHFDSSSAGGTADIRVYWNFIPSGGDESEYLEFVSGARWDGTDWINQLGFAGSQPMRIRFRNVNNCAIDVQTVDTSGSPVSWTDAAWRGITMRARMDDASSPVFFGLGTLEQLNIPKVWADVESDGLGGVTIYDSYGLASATISINDIHLVFNTGFIDAATGGAAANYSMVMAPKNSPAVPTEHWVTLNPMDASIDLRAFTGAGVQLTLGAGVSRRVCVIIFGRGGA